MLYISLSAVCIKEVNDFNKTWLKHIEYAESEFRTFEFIICKFIVVYTTKSEQNIQKLSKIIVENSFNSFTRVIGWADSDTISANITWQIFFVLT